MTKIQLVPFDFVLEALFSLEPTTKPMFGCTAVYVREKIVFVLREKEDFPQDNGVWLATSHEHHSSLRLVFPEMRSISVLGTAPTGWQILPADSQSFEEDVFKACEMVTCKDPRIGKIPKKKTAQKLKSNKKRPTKKTKNR